MLGRTRSVGGPGPLQASSSRSNIQPFTIYCDPELRHAPSVPAGLPVEHGVLAQRNAKAAQLASASSASASLKRPLDRQPGPSKPRLPVSKSLDFGSKLGPAAAAALNLGVGSAASSGAALRPRKPKVSVKQAAAELTPTSNECFTRLLVVRRKILQDLNDENLAPWDVISNDQLSVIAKARPITLDELFGLPGMEEARVRDFAHEIIEAVLEFQQARAAAEALPHAPRRPSSAPLAPASPPPAPAPSPSSTSASAPAPEEEEATAATPARGERRGSGSASREEAGSGPPSPAGSAGSAGDAGLQVELRALRRLFLEERARRQSAERRASDLEREADALAARLARSPVADRDEATALQGRLSALEDRLRDTTCVACLERPRRVVLMPCMHLCVCEACQPRIENKCPLCRAPVAGHVASRL
eukprot:tig00021572_g22407.t1